MVKKADDSLAFKGIERFEDVTDSEFGPNSDEEKEAA